MSDRGGREAANPLHMLQQMDSAACVEQLGAGDRGARRARASCPLWRQGTTPRNGLVQSTSHSPEHPPLPPPPPVPHSSEASNEMKYASLLVLAAIGACPQLSAALLIIMCSCNNATASQPGQTRNVS